MMKHKGIYWWLAAMVMFGIAMVFIAFKIYYHPFNLIRQDIQKLNEDVQELIQKIEKQEAFVRTLETVDAVITAYSPTEDQCDSDPLITASMARVRVGIVALSRDLEKKYNLKFGDIVYIYGLGPFHFQDRMHKRWTKKVDVFMWSRQEALQFGRQERRIQFIKNSEA
jgi:3D (Asp-Asp-Asp) domain-containing protein